jgi:hypothetical protein
MKQRIQKFTTLADRECEVGALLTKERTEFEHDGALLTYHLKLAIHRRFSRRRRGLAYA